MLHLRVGKNKGFYLHSPKHGHVEKEVFLFSLSYQIHCTVNSNYMYVHSIPWTNALMILMWHRILENVECWFFNFRVLAKMGNEIHSNNIRQSSLWFVNSYINYVFMIKPYNINHLKLKEIWQRYSTWKSVIWSLVFQISPNMRF